MTVSRLIARPMLASIFLVGAAAALKNTAGTAAKADPVTARLVPLARKAGIPLPEDPETLVRINAGVQLGAGLMLATGRAPGSPPPCWRPPWCPRPSPDTPSGRS